ncbi:MAG: penicillin-binding transpeptidase domain-containing protein, partial [Bacteroidales bacterium]|nr:penicillin-binding transpeptidase domain-containing protein [Bacteroidales bacterium]
SRPNAAHVLGYIGETSPRQIEIDPYYKQGDYVGISGVERTYENVLRGQKGVKIKMVDVHNREVGTYMDGRFDTIAIMGDNLFITLDARLQAYGETLMANKRGSIVAIEPLTGEVLALVSSPSYDPNLLIGRIRAYNYNRLFEDSLKPLFNRALMATYPPGSTFKLANALVGLHQGVIVPQTRYGCSGRETKPIRCSHSHYSPLALIEAIEHSCNPYFWGVYRAIIENPTIRNTENAFNRWRSDMLSLGLGNPVGLDLFSEQGGKIPLASEYNRIYGKGRWRALTIRSLSIGQGEILLTPLQMANLAAAIANRGFFYPPHLVKAIRNNDSIKPLNIEKRISNIEPQHFDVIIDGMHRVFTAGHGTARWYALPDILMCGKTGTAENPHGKDHSLFIAFAPKDDPKIAIAVVVENAGFGATWAVPIAVLMMEKYLKGEISRPWVEEKMLTGKP